MHTADLNLGFTWQHSFANLGPQFHTEQEPTPLPDPYWVGKSDSAAQLLGLPPDMLGSDALLQALAGNCLLPGSRPLASVYSGHQFGQWAGQLGDGRAILLGEGVPKNHALRGPAPGLEIQLKGAGATPYSRMGDGRAVLRSSIREFLGSEAMHGLGIATSRALCVTGSDARVRREEIETAAVVTRLAPSFVRFGHFEHFSYFAEKDDYKSIKKLANYVIDKFYPACRSTPKFNANPYANLLETVSEKTAALLAQWQCVGFCHGVMNTDNMSILGLTIDYGPFQFLDAYVPAHICNHSDNQGRYAFNRQPNIAYWNLYALGQALLPLISEGGGSQELAVAALESYKTAFPAAFEAGMGKKLGLSQVLDTDRSLIEDILKLMAQDGTDFSIFWRRLSRFVAGDAQGPVRDMFLDRVRFDTWLLRYQERLATVNPMESGQLMLQTNPKFVLRNHLGEEAIQKAKQKDFSGVQNLLMLLERPFDEHPGFEAYADFPPAWAKGIEISCSS